MEKETFSIPNISCGHCVMTIKNELKALEGVESVAGDPESKQITVEKMMQPRKQVIEYTITLKFDPEYAYGGFISLGANVSIS